ncbi:MAG: 16S rRNA (cytosine(1402)-N(4))-methyltransferase RsmH [Gemmatimonadales bacterium]
MPSSTYHVPVLAAAVADLARGRHRAVDATVGGGGHTLRLRALGAEILGIDRDPDALAEARRALGDDPQVQLLQAPFASEEALAAVHAFAPDFILLDLGVSSHQLDADERGFSFRPGAPLDMRMDPTSDSTAAHLLNTLPSAELADLFFIYGDERRARRLANTVIERRPLATSDDLVAAIRRTLGPASGPGDFARLFQAVRMAVNSELEQLAVALPACRNALVNGGVLAVITYHSGEDRAVKQAFREWSRACVCPPKQPVCTCRGVALGALVFRKPVMATPDEVAENPRARSARLRAFVRTDGA